MCEFEGCGRPDKVKSLCKTHYMQQWHGKPLVPIRPRRETPEKAGLRQCGGCLEWKDRESEFYNSSNGGKQSKCKPCYREQRKKA